LCITPAKGRFGQGSEVYGGAGMKAARLGCQRGVQRGGGLPSCFVVNGDCYVAR
jgi:hypothetical protein